jgi:shikimate dehydrogenase
MQNAGIAALGLNWRYLAFEVSPYRLQQAISGAKAMNFIGLNLTVPHKLHAADMVDALDGSARRWGTVNTIRFEGKDNSGNWQPLCSFADSPSEIRSHGFNTDAEAIVQALRDDLSVELAGAKVLILGAGGAGRTAALKLPEQKVRELFLVNRTQSKAASLADDIRKHWPAVTVSLGYPTGKVDLVLNATSLGLKESDALPFDESRFSLEQTAAVYDMIYRPAETQLLRRARESGSRAANGLGMLLYQGAKALEIWTGRKAPVDVMRRALEENVYGK